MVFELLFFVHHTDKIKDCKLAKINKNLLNFLIFCASKIICLVFASCH